VKTKYNVHWSLPAENDLFSIIKYISNERPLTARKIFSKIKRRANTLRFSPQRGRVCPEFQRYGILTYRELLIPPWRLIYRNHKNEVLITAIFDGRRNLEDVLFERLLQ